MSKTEFSQFSKPTKISRLALYATIVTVLGIAIMYTTNYVNRKKALREIGRLSCELRKNKDAQNKYIATASEFTENKNLKHTLDSLEELNLQMFYDTQKQYQNRIDKKYPMGLFFKSAQIAQLNRMVMPYVHKISKFNPELKKITPFTASTTLSQFQYVLQSVNIPPEKFAPLDMIINEGFLLGFNDARQEKLYESYLEELSRIYSDFATNEPNFDIPENAKIRNEYMRNKNTITELNARIQGNGFLISQTIANFQHKSDSLSALREKYQNKLR